MTKHVLPADTIWTWISLSPDWHILLLLWCATSDLDRVRFPRAAFYLDALEVIPAPQMRGPPDLICPASCTTSTTGSNLNLYRPLTNVKTGCVLVTSPIPGAPARAQTPLGTRPPGPCGKASCLVFSVPNHAYVGCEMRNWAAGKVRSCAASYQP